MAQQKTPGVYIQELDAFGNSVVEVPTAIPAFIGYTNKAAAGNTDLLNRPTRITSLLEYETLFGGPPPLAVTADKAGKMQATSRYLMHQSMRMFFMNGGGPCYVVSVGGYTDDKGAATTLSAKTLISGLQTLELEPEPTMLVVPDAVLLSTVDEWAKVATQMLAQCEKLQSRMAILDVFNGDKPRGNQHRPIDDFRSKVGTNFLNYGIAYYPFLNTSILEPTALTFKSLDKDLLATVVKNVRARMQSDADAAAGPGKTGKIPDPVEAFLKDLDLKTPDDRARTVHQTMMSISPVYRDAMTEALAAVNLMPPSAAMAGVITTTDNSIGVWKAPANTSINGVISPAVTISHDEQEDLNVPLDGKAVNAIRTMMGRGVLVWGARTLDGNSQDWRYISVRRTLIMLEQSIKNACEAYVFAPNDASTWVTVSAMIENFLNNQWKAGALAGATPGEAYDVQVGLGSTMTGNDILDGFMRVTIRVAPVRPAEFIILTFQQKMQTS